MSPRAAWRLEQLGYEQVYDYVAGKMDWLAFALPYEGQADLVVSHLERDVSVCRAADTVGDVVDRGGDDEACIVLNDAEVVQGAIRPGALSGVAGAVAVTEVMEVGVATVRPSEEVHALDERLRAAGRKEIVVTRSDGTFLGIHASRA